MAGMRPSRRAAVLALGLLLSPVAARAGEEAAKAADAAGAKARAALPEPVEEANLAFEWKGDLVLAGEAAGTLTLSVDVGEDKRKPVWIVLEEMRQEWGGSGVD